MRKFKGFTLVELIVVLATFSIIMFGALSLMTPVSKMMVQADVHEGASAAASNISRYLEQELSGVEYLHAGNGLLDETNMNDRVNSYVLDYYEGVLRAGSTTGSQQYAGGDIHVLTIDNTKDAKISKYTYHYKDFSVTGCALTSKDDVPYAINKAYYDDYDFQIKVGTFDDLETFNNPDSLYQQLYDPTKTSETERAQNYFSSNVSTAVNFTIMTTANGNHTDYHFLTNTTFPLVNLINRSTVYPSGCYYIINQENDTTVTPPVKNSIIDMAAAGWTTKSSDPDPSKFSLCRTRGPASVSIATSYDAAYGDNGYWFIYSYGSEINTKKTATS